MSCSCNSLGFRLNVPAQFAANLALRAEKRKILLPLRGEGSLHFHITTTHDSRVLAVQLEDAQLHLQETHVRLSNEHDKVVFPPTYLGRHVFDIANCQGTLNIETKELELKLHLTLTPDVFPQFHLAGIHGPITLILHEKGTLDLATRTIHVEGYRIEGSTALLKSLIVHPGSPHEIAALDYRNGFQTCDAIMEAGVSFDKVTSYEQAKEKAVPEITICPGKTLSIAWQSRGTNQKYIINDDSKNSVGIGVNGVMTVKDVTQSTKYTFSAEGNQKDKDDHFCVTKREVQINVVTAGEAISLSASPISDSPIWSLQLSPYAYDPAIKVTSIRTVPCFGATGVYPRWNCKKTDLDGTPHALSFGIDTSPVGLQLVGTWLFWLDGAENYVTAGSACFEVTVACV